MLPRDPIDDPVPDPTPTMLEPSRSWCLFESGAGSYAVGLESVAEVVEVERLVRLPHSPRRLLGLCTLRREVIPVIDLDGLGKEPSFSTAQASAKIPVLILRASRGTWAVRINAEGTIVAEEPLEDPVPPIDARGLVFLGTVRRDAGVYGAIDPESTWRHVRQSVEDWYCDQLGRESTTAAAPVCTASRSALASQERASR